MQLLQPAYYCSLFGLLDVRNALQPPRRALASRSPLRVSLLAGGRGIGNFGVPEHWGKKSEYTEGTGFLGTPKNHLDLVKKRPLAPDVLSLDGKGMHYKMPPAAISSIVNRVTGVAMTGGMLALAGAGLTGDTVALIEAFKALGPVAVLPAKVGVTFPVLFHLLGGVRHLVWDSSKIGNQVGASMLDRAAVEQSSYFLFGVSGFGSLLIALS